MVIIFINLHHLVELLVFLQTVELVVVQRQFVVVEHHILVQVEVVQGDMSQADRDKENKIKEIICALILLFLLNIDSSKLLL